MKSKLIALALFATTAAVVAAYPLYEGSGTATTLPPQVLNPPANAQPQIEVAFVLDTTGSMSGLIEAAKEKIWSIASTLASTKPAPEIKMGLVAYRDRGDQYVTKVVDLSHDLDAMYAKLMDFQADGGGDGPESVNQALFDAVHKLSWSVRPDAYKVVFLVGDAPPHMDYQDDVKYPDTLAAAQRKRITVNALQCGQHSATTRQWEKIAQLGNGQYLQVEQTGNAVAIVTPYDERLAKLSAQLDETRIYYGSAEERAQRQRKVEAADKLHASSSIPSRARRAAYNASPSGELNFLGEGELVDDVASGRVDVSSIAPAELPESIRAMAPEEQASLLKEKIERRAELKGEIETLAEQRGAFLKQRVEELGGARDSLDHKIYSAVREQAAKSGLSYEADGLAY